MGMLHIPKQAKATNYPDAHKYAHPSWQVNFRYRLSVPDLSDLRTEGISSSFIDKSYKQKWGEREAGFWNLPEGEHIGDKSATDKDTAVKAQIKKDKFPGLDLHKTRQIPFY